MPGRAHSGGFYEVEEAPGKGVPLPPSEGIQSHFLYCI